ncbi:MAG: IS1595 family transposase [Gammaproteobacteria bacterium]|nr:IS1595 family transposase [Gammaproteobacteria bacterium]
MQYEAPNRTDRKHLSMMQLMDMFPNEEAATQWFESIVWPTGQRCCGKCGSERTRKVPNAKPMPYWCTDCRSYFSVRTGTPIARSNVPLRKWAIAIYLCLTSLKSVASNKLQNDIDVSQPTAWFMLHRIREAWAHEPPNNKWQGPVEADETYFGGKRENMPASKRKMLTGRGTVGKTIVAGAKDRPSKQVRAKVVARADTPTLSGLVQSVTQVGADVFTDDFPAYNMLGAVYKHRSIKHGAGQYVDGPVHTNGIESFWSMLKRAHKGTFHKLSPKHLNRYIQEFVAKQNMRDSDTLVQMRDTVARLVGRNLLYRDLIADNGLSNASR